MIFHLRTHQARQRAQHHIAIAPDGWVCRLTEGTRTLQQNARMWAMLNDVSRHVEWHGVKLSPEDWKHVFSASLRRQRVVPGLDGELVVLGQSTSKMTKHELSDLMELISAFGAERGVQWSAYE